MPITAQLDQGTPGSPLPLEGDDESKYTGFIATANNALTAGLGTTLEQRGIAALVGGPQVSQADAQAKMKAQGYDSSSIPAGGVTQGALDIMMKRQSDIAVNNSVASRANLGGASRFAASIVGSIPDPVNLAFGLAGKVVAPLVAGGRVVRAVGGAVEGAVVGGAQTYGAQAVGHGLGDQDQSSMDNLRTVLFGAALGGGLHVGFGGKTPVVKDTPGSTDLREQIISQVAKAEDSTGTGIITHDTGGLTKFGISQKAHPDVDIANLTQEKAAAIFKSDYWDKINGDTLPANVQHTAMDAAVNQGVENANKWLKESGGDPEKFNQLRADDYNRLAKADPAKYGKYLNGWLKRLENVANEPVLAQGSAPRIASVDTMGENVDQLPADTRNAALETAVNQFKVDDDVNVEQVINKSLEEHYGVKPDTDFDPTGETPARAPESYTTEEVAAAHNIDIDEVNYRDSEYVKRIDIGNNPGDVPFTRRTIYVNPKQIERLGGGNVSKEDVTIHELGHALAGEYGLNDTEARTPLRKEINAAAKDFEPQVAQPATHAVKPRERVANAISQWLKHPEERYKYPELSARLAPAEEQVKSYRLSRAQEMQGADTDLTKAIPQAGRALVTSADTDRIAGVKASIAESKPVIAASAAEKDSPLVAEAKSTMQDAVKEAETFHANTIGPFVPDEKLTPEQNAAAQAEHDAPQTEFEKEMADHDEAIAAHNEFAKGVEAAVRCASSMGVG